ncbi:unnamed protein product [Auanema sp. JU1783]|nr:unnamed protein product [Auanema sp. JU1783]
MKINYLLLITFILSPVFSANEEYSARKSFHDRLCAKRPTLKSCLKPFTESDYQKEKEQFAQFKTVLTENKTSSRNGRKRAVWSSEEDEDYEYYMWRKYQREKYKRRYGTRPSSDETVRHVHYHQPSYHQNYNNYNRYPHQYYNQGYYSYPSYSYPSYGYGYPSYGGYGGGYGGGGLFNMGFGRQLGIMTPIGGFGLSSGFGIGIGNAMHPGEQITLAFGIFTLAMTISIIFYYKVCKKNPYANSTSLLVTHVPSKRKNQKRIF